LIALLNKFEYKGDKFDNINLTPPHPQTPTPKGEGALALKYL
jgi:hypothetical protein